MTQAAISYVEQTSTGSWRVAGTRISLDSVIHAYWEGRPPEAIAADFPTLTLEQIHGAIAFYLHHRADLDSYLTAQDAKWEQLRQESESKNAALLSRIRASKASRDDAKPDGR